MRACHTSLALLLLLCAAPAYGGLGTIDAGDTGLWDKWGYSVIVARVVSVDQLEGKGDDVGGTHIAKLEPFATLAGRFDPSKAPSLAVRFFALETTTSIHEVPVVGSMVLAVICPASLGGNEKRKYTAVTSEICTFMPNRSALVTVSELDDKRILETLKRIREVRNKTDDNRDANGK